MPTLPTRIERQGARLPLRQRRNAAKRISGTDISQTNPGQSAPNPTLPNIGKDVGESLTTFGGALKSFIDRVDTAKISATENAFNNYKGEHLRRINLLRGEQAIGATEQATKLFDSNLGINDDENPVQSESGLRYQELFNGLNDRQRQIFEARIRTSRDPFLNSAARKEQIESQVFFDETYKSSVLQSVDNVMRDPENPQVILQERERLTEMAISNGVEKGHSPERVQQEISDRMADIHGGVVEGKILGRNFEGARQYIRANDAEISSAKKFKLMADILTAEDAADVRDRRDLKVRQTSTHLGHLVAITEGNFSHTAFLFDAKKGNLTPEGYKSILASLKEDVITDPESMGLYLTAIENPEIRVGLDEELIAQDHQLSIKDRIKIIDRLNKRTNDTSIENSSEYKRARKKFSAAYNVPQGITDSLLKKKEKRRLAAEEEFQFRVFDRNEDPVTVIDDMIANEPAFNKRDTPIVLQREKNLMSRLPESARFTDEKGAPSIPDIKDQLRQDMADGKISPDDFPEIADIVEDLEEIAEKQGRPAGSSNLGSGAVRPESLTEPPDGIEPRARTEIDQPDDFAAPQEPVELGLPGEIPDIGARSEPESFSRAVDDAVDTVEEFIGGIQKSVAEELIKLGILDEEGEITPSDSPRRFTDAELINALKAQNEVEKQLIQDRKKLQGRVIGKDADDLEKRSLEASQKTKELLEEFKRRHNADAP